MSAQHGCASNACPMGLVLAASLLVAGAAARAAEVDTEHLFGFTEGTDVGKPGEREFESETIARFGKAAGSYAVVTPDIGAKVTPADNLRLGVGVAGSYAGIAGVPGLADVTRGRVQALSFEARYRLLDGEQGPFGLTIVAEPRWSFADDTSGVSAAAFGGALTLAADKELITDRLYGAVNLSYEPQTVRLAAAGGWASDATLSASAALSVQVQPGLFVGGEIRSLRAYDGAGLASFAGRALFAGPTFYLQLAPRVGMSAAWSTQVAGHDAAMPGALDLTHFERQQAKLRFNVSF